MRRKKLFRSRWTFLFTAILLIAILVIIQIQSSGEIHRLPPIWSAYANPILGGLSVLFALLAVVNPFEAKAAVVSLKAAGRPAFPDKEHTQLRESVVKGVYELLTKDNVTGIALVGIEGSGKTVLAHLVEDQYVECHHHSIIFSRYTSSIWITIPNDDFTLTDLGIILLMKLGKSPADFDGMSDQDKAAKLFNALNEKERLVILDQFENILDSETGLTLDKSKGIGEWLDMINTQPCKSHMLFTSRLYPRGNKKPYQERIREYAIKGLDTAEGMKLLDISLRDQEIKKEADFSLRRAVERCGGHPGALEQLPIVMVERDVKSLSAFLDSPSCDWFWRKKIANFFLERVHIERLRRNIELYELLLSFSIYREPVSLDAVAFIRDTVSVMSEDKREDLSDKLKDLQLLQVIKKDSGEKLYKLIAIITHYAQDHFVENDETANLAEVKKAHLKAASYYKGRADTGAFPLEERGRLLIEAAWHYLRGGEKDKAYELLNDERILNSLLNLGI